MRWDGGYKRYVLGFYAHHQGAGHLIRTLTVAAHIDEPVVVFSSRSAPIALPPNVEFVELPGDLDPGVDDPQRGGSWHWAPAGTRGQRQRSRILVERLTRADIDLLVVDVSVEVLCLARLCGVPTVAVRDQGDRTDGPHRLKYASASAVMAPFPEVLDDERTDQALRSRTTYVGLFSRYFGRDPDGRRARARLGLEAEGNLAIVVIGQGGTDHTWDGLCELGIELSAWRLVVVGADDVPVPSSPRLTSIGLVDDPFDWMAAGDVIIGHCGANFVAEAAAADRPLICMPQARPHDEQWGRARRLDALGAAVVLDRWPTAGDVEAAVAVGSERLHRWSLESDPERVVAWLMALRSGAVQNASTVGRSPDRPGGGGTALSRLAGP